MEPAIGLEQRLQIRPLAIVQPLLYFFEQGGVAPWFETQGCVANAFGGIGQQAAHSLSGALSGGQLPLHGGGRKGGLQGLRLAEFVDLGVVEQAALLHDRTRRERVL